MYCIKLEIQPTGALTFRKMPGSILDITTYPFLPPTTMSGFLRRLCLLSAGHDLPETTVSTKDQTPPFYALPPHMLATGALPIGAKAIHKTHRKGPRKLNHYGFSRLFRDDMPKDESIQLHTWEYFFCEQLIGYVIAHQKGDLEAFEACLNWGCKIGKEGYAYLRSVGPITRLKKERCPASPSTLLSPDALGLDDLSQPMEIFGLYRFQWEEGAPSSDPREPSPSPVIGYAPISVALMSPQAELELEYYHDGESYISCHWLHTISGGSP